MMEIFISIIRISLKFVPDGPFDNKSALVQVMAWFKRGGKRLPEPLLTQFTDAYLTDIGKIGRCSVGLPGAPLPNME